MLQVTRHWLGLLRGGLLAHQSLAMASLGAFLPSKKATSKEAPSPVGALMAEAVEQYFTEMAGAGQDVLAQLAHAHPHADGGEDGQRGGGCALPPPPLPPPPPQSPTPTTTTLTNSQTATQKMAR